MFGESTIWSELSSTEQARLLARPAVLDDQKITEQSAQIIATVRRDGDAALFNFARQFEARDLHSLKVSSQELLARKPPWMTRLKRRLTRRSLMSGASMRRKFPLRSTCP